MLLFNMALARIINLPETLADIGYQHKWHPAGRQRVRDIIRSRQDRGLKTFSSAYMVTGTESKGMQKVDFILLLMDRLWAGYDMIDYECLQTCASSIERKGISTFLQGQIIADVKYTPFLKGAYDWASWSNPGPGSVRGLHRLHGRDYNKGMSIDQYDEEMKELRRIGVPLQMHAQDLQNCLCEFDKYCRVKFGQGVPRQQYVPTKENR